MDPDLWWRFDDTTGAERRGVGPTFSYAGCAEDLASPLSAELGASWSSGPSLVCGPGGAVAPSSSALDLDPITFAFWYRPEDLAACAENCFLVARGDADELEECGIKVSLTGQGLLRVSHGDGTNDLPVIASPATALFANDWIHVATTWDGTTLTLYREGSAVATSIPGTALAWNGRDLYVGGLEDRAQYVLGGRIDELAVWGRALGPAEVAAARAWYLDGDGDGFNADDDCAPADPDSYLGAAEIPGDGIDQDCDGADDPAPSHTGAPPHSAEPAPHTAEPPHHSGSAHTAVVDPDVAERPSIPGDPGCGCASTSWTTGSWLSLLALRRRRLLHRLGE